VIYLAALILAFSVFILFKEKGNIRFFLFSLVLGLILSFFGFIAYLNKLEKSELYLYMLSKALYGKDILQNMDFVQAIDASLTITIMNFGVLLFVYSVLCFVISFTNPLKSSIRIYLLLGIPPIIQFVLYLPWVYESWYKFLFVGPLKGFINFTDLFFAEDILYNVTRFINYSYCALAIILLIYHYFRTPRLKYFRSYALLIFSALFSTICLFETVLGWAPKRLVSVTTLSSYVHILPVSLFLEGRALVLFPYIFFVSMILISFAMYKYNNTYLNLRNIKNSIIRSIDISSIGIRFFTHMIKNYAMATVIDAEALKRKMQSSEDCIQYVDRIISSNNELLERLNEIKSKFSSVSLRLELIDVRVPIESALEKVNIEGIELIFKHNEETPLVLMDLKHMTETIVNILNNAVHEMKGDTKNLTIDISQEKLWVFISISDTGRGIEPENLNKIFVPFYTTKSRKDNWGLGLSYCYRVIMAHKGKIFVESELGKGTTFKIILPLIKTVQVKSAK
jgi:signal transduction histidine kinase